MHMSDGTTRKRRVWITVLAAVTVASVIAAVLTGLVARRLYLDRVGLRLTPTFEARFRDANARLAPVGKPRIVMFGDSRVEYWQPKPELPNAEIVWRGIGGETTTQMVHRFAADTQGISASVVVMQAGINDLTAGVALGIGPSAMNSAYENLRTMVEGSTAAGAHVFLLTVVPPASPSLARRVVWSASIYDLTAQLNARLQTLAGPRVTVVDAARLLCGPSARLPQNLAADTLHFLPAAYQRLNGELIRQLQATSALQP